jgi:hypothetical protein
MQTIALLYARKQLFFYLLVLCGFCAGLQAASAQTSVAPQAVSLAPVISSLSPASVFEGDCTFTLTIRGYGFQNGAQVLMSAEPLLVLRVDSTAITVRVPAALVARVGLPVVLVRNPDGQAVGARYAVQEKTATSPIITKVNPNVLVTWSRTTTLTVQGSNLGNIVSAIIDGLPLTIIRASQSEAVVGLPPQEQLKCGILPLSLLNPDGISASTEILLDCKDLPNDTIIVTPPSNTQRTGTTFQFTIAGSNFIAGSVILLLGVKRDTLRPSSITKNQIIVTVPLGFRQGQYVLRVIRPNGEFIEQPYGILTASGAVWPYLPYDPTLSLFPNPATEALTISAELPAPTRVMVRVLNVLQREALPAHTEQAQSGLWTTQIDLSTLPRGAYTVELTSSDGAFAPQVRQVLKQ